MNKKNTAAIHSLGCKVNEYESRVIEENLRDNGYSIVPFDEIADVYVINTCTVTAISDKKSRQMIRRARHRNPDAIIVATGCFVEKDQEAVKPYCDIILGNNNKSHVIEEIEKFKETNEKSGRMEDLFLKDTAFESMMLRSTGVKSRAFIKIQDGCNAYCSYCIIPYVRGKSRSRNIDEIIEEATVLSKKGQKEIVLCGINLSDYRDEKGGLPEVLKRLNDIDTVKRIRLGSLEPDVFSEEFVNTALELNKLCPHFHFSLQSACDKTLKNMRRRYDVNTVKEAILRLREGYKNPALCADVIAGFPGETDEDFNTTLEFIKDAKFYELHVFPYSEREGTRALNMQGKLLKATKQERAKRLIDLSLSRKQDYMDSFSERESQVLFEESEEIQGKSYFTGFNREYIRCYKESDKDISGEIVVVKVKDTGFMDHMGMLTE